MLEGGNWRELADPPEARAAAAAAVSLGKLYVVGGLDERGLAQVALVLDLRTGRWSRIPGPTKREHLAAAAARASRLRCRRPQRRYRHEHESVRVVRPEDTALDAARAPPVCPRRHRRDRVTGRIVSVGGEQPSGTIASVYAYDLRTRRWRRLPDLPSPRHGLGVVAYRGRVFTLAGGPQPGLTVSGVVESLRVG